MKNFGYAEIVKTNKILRNSTILVAIGIILSVIVIVACQPVAARNGEPQSAQSRTYTVPDIGEVTAWRDISTGNTCYFWGSHFFCVAGD